LAGTYILQDPTEQALVADGTIPADTIPVVIQEKTYVPDNTTPVLNFYGPFKSALNSQDPTWRWGTGKAATGKMGNGDLWVPHVFMPNQNPGDVTGANAVGRWDYGAWFWPPFAGLQNGPLPNPYYDPNCDTTTQYCEGPEIPGVPNGSLKSVLSNGVPGGVPDINKGGAITESPSATPESFNDTPLVNGTAYPYVNVDPKKYRLRILSVANDRMLNLSLVVAASKNAPSTSLANSGSKASAPAVMCDGSINVDPADCTEVKMVPFDSTQDTFTPFPSHWYSPQKGGVTFDARPGGVFDPTTRGPAMVQIGTEGGFLPKPVVIPNQPVNYEYNPKNILIGNIKEHALLLGNAERADVVVDFSNFAGSTLILYNDAPAPVPAWDLRLDYFTGNFDNTDTGGAFSVIPGYGPNSRTLMQFRVSGSGGSHPVDDLGGINTNTLTDSVQTAFKTSQEPVIVPQAVYNPVYGTSMPDAVGQNLSRISDTALSYQPYNAATGVLDPKVTLEMEPKTIIEDWTMSWGRMNALLGTEVPHTTAINQTSIPQAYIDPPTELVKITPNDNMVPVTGTLPDGTQIWKITHNGVDSHAVHFHLFNVQLVNRVGWDGAVYPPDANELGWKDTVRMNPLSDVIVALRPMQMKALPFKVPNSHRSIVPGLAMGATTPHAYNFNPMTGQASNVTNLPVNFGWEYIWHCHLLGHEENDMMRAIAVAQPPEKPLNLTATASGKNVLLKWTDDSIIANWVTIQRSLDNFKTVQAAFNVVVPECNNQAGCDRTYTDTSAPNVAVYYRVMANNTVGAGDGKLDAPRKPDGTYGDTLLPELSSLTPGFDGFSNVTANSNWSSIALRAGAAVGVATVTPGSILFPDTAMGATYPTTTTGRQMITIQNTGTASLSVTGISINGAAFVRGNSTTTSNTAYRGSCSTSAFTLAAGASCTYNVMFKPTATACIGAINGNLKACSATLTVTDNSNGIAGSTQTVSLSGNGIASNPQASVSTNLLTFASTNVGITSTAQTITLNNTGTAALAVSSVSFPSGFVRSGGTCSTTATFNVAAGANCTIGVAFKPTLGGQATGNLLITNNSGGIVNSTQSVALSGTGVASPLYAKPDTTTVMSNTTTTQMVTVNVRANDLPVNTGAVAVVSMSKTATASATVTISADRIVLAMVGAGATTSAKQASKRGVYTITYSLTNGGETVQSTATITVN
jgi:FtsP/CotA-like multicopper oxidase with cupredoxin domain